MDGWLDGPWLEPDIFQYVLLHFTHWRHAFSELILKCPKHSGFQAVPVHSNKLSDLSFVFRKVVYDAQIRARSLDIRRALYFGSHCAMKLMYQQRPFVHYFYYGEVVTVWRNVGKVFKLIFC